MPEIHVTVDDYSKEVMEATENAIIRGLEACGIKARDIARDLVPVDTGKLKSMIDYEVDGEVCYIGVKAMQPAPYGIYVEFGTGVHAEHGDGRKTPWSYQDANGQWHHTDGMSPQPFIKPTIADHQNEYIDILAQSLDNM